MSTSWPNSVPNSSTLILIAPQVGSLIGPELWLSELLYEVTSIELSTCLFWPSLTLQNMDFGGRAVIKCGTRSYVDELSLGPFGLHLRVP